MIKALLSLITLTLVAGRVHCHGILTIPSGKRSNGLELKLQLLSDKWHLPALGDFFNNQRRSPSVFVSY
jgi:hypothetical protein